MLVSIAKSLIQVGRDFGLGPSRSISIWNFISKCLNGNAEILDFRYQTQKNLMIIANIS